MKSTLCILLNILFLTLPIIAQQKDNPECKDHPLFTRMPDSWIHSCAQKEFDAHVFNIGKGKTAQVEGHYWEGLNIFNPYGWGIWGVLGIRQAAKV